MHHLVYQITNVDNGKIYIGVHSTDKVNDGYMGSGTRIRKAIAEYGLGSFRKEILFDFSTRKEALEKEKELVCKDFLKENLCYNMVMGGGGWPLAVEPTLKYDPDHYYEFYQVYPACQVPVRNHIASLEAMMKKLDEYFNPMEMLSKLANNRKTHKDAMKFFAMLSNYEAWRYNIAAKKVSWEGREHLLTQKN